MKKSLLRVIAAVAVLVPTISANAALYNYTEQFDGNGMHFNLNFTADDTSTTVITTFNGTADTDILILLAPDIYNLNDNLFDPSTIATEGGWGFNGISFHNTVSGDDFNVYNDLGLTMTSTMPVTDTFNNFTYSASPVPVPVPAALWLFASGLGLLTVGCRKKIA